jgi:hemolysin III
MIPPWPARAEDIEPSCLAQGRQSTLMIMQATTYTRGEEIANSLTHGMGLLLSVGGLAVLVTFAALHGDAWTVTACSIFGASLVLLYTSSTLYHAIQASRLKQALRVVDHVAIFLLIAGTYTPFMLVNLRGPWGWSLFGVVWALAIAGTALKIFFTGRFRVLSTLVYLFMGWIIVVAIKPLVVALPREGLIMLFAGGLAYSLGTVFYLWKRLPYHHAVWHLFVLAGSICHFFAVFASIAPRGA